MPQNCTSGSFLGLFCIHKYTSIIVLTPFRFLGKHPNFLAMCFEAEIIGKRKLDKDLQFREHPNQV
jgi:hypothetical protein